MVPTPAPTRPRSTEAAALLLIRLSACTLLLAGLARSIADPDLWGHVRFGSDILRQGLTSVDPYSFTSDVPWVNHEWLAEVVLYAAWSAAGNSGLIALKMVVIVATLWLAALALRDGPTSTARDLTLFVLLVGLWARVFVIRPQIFSIVLFAALLWTLRAAERGRPRTLWLLPVLFVVWVNSHGGWIVGMGALLVWTTAAVAGFNREVPTRTALVAAAGALLATLVNPYGPQLWAFLSATVSLARPNINDWRPLAESGAQVIVPWCISAALAAVAAARGGRRIPLAHAAITIGLGAASVRVNRLDVFFTISTVMLLAPWLTAPAGAVPAPRWTGPTRAAALAFALVFAGAGWHQRETFTCVRLDGPWMPDREAGAFISANGLEGRLLSWFDWGQYAIWHFAPRLAVSLDGRRETVYSDAFVARHLRLYYQPELEPGLLDDLAPDYAWLPASLPLTSTLERAGWHRLYSGPISVVLAREGSPAGLTTPGLVPDACFPGP